MSLPVRFNEAVNTIIPRARRFDDELTPSALVLETLRKRNSSLARFGLFQSKQHAEYFKGLVGHEQSNLETLCVTSRLHQQELERASIGELDAYVQTYISRISQLHS